MAKRFVLESLRACPRTAMGLIVALFLAGGCGEDASPTIPAPLPLAPPPVEAPAPPRIRAEEVVDRETLRVFVEAAIEAASAGIASEIETYPFFDTVFRPEGQWRHGEIYLFVMDLNGTSVFHAAFPEFEGQDFLDIVDARGVQVTKELLAVAGAGGGYVEYLWPNPAVEGDEDTGSPKVGYAATVTLAGQDFVIASGIYPPVTAADVRNRGTLKSFVERAASVVAENGPDPESAYAFLDENFRLEGEWRYGEIYVFVIKIDVITMDLVDFFHPIHPALEGESAGDGGIVGRLWEAASAGGGYVEFLFDNPTVEGDEETGSPKLAYTTPMMIGSVPMFLTSGIYPDHPVATISHRRTHGIPDSPDLPPTDPATDRTSRRRSWISTGPSASRRSISTGLPPLSTGPSSELASSIGAASAGGGARVVIRPGECGPLLRPGVRVTVVPLGQALGRGGGSQFLHALLRAQVPSAQFVDGATHRVQVQPCAVERQVGDDGPLEGLVPAVGFPGGRAGRPQEVPRQRGGAGAPVAPLVPGGRGVGPRSAQARHVRAACGVAVERDAPVGHRLAPGIGA